MDHRANFYKQNPHLKQLILDFYAEPAGVRCRVKHPHGELHPVYRNNKISAAYGGDYGYPLVSITEDNIDYELSTATTQHFLYYIFDEGILQCDSKSEIAEHIIGLTCVMDIDSPYINPDVKKKTRYDSMGSKSPHIREMFDTLKEVARIELQDVGYWKDTRIMWSGNGFYIILPDFYGTPQEVAEHMTSFIGLERYVNSVCREEYGFSQDLCDERLIPWNRYCKCIFTFHSKYPRVSIPLDREAPLTGEINCCMKDW